MQHIPEWLVKTPIAHRGLHDAATGVIENSLPAFWAAARSGYPAELDVRLLADGNAVVFHDRDLDRLTNASGPIAARTSGDLKDVFLAGVSDADPNTDDARIPLLGRVLDMIAGSTPLLIEIKNEGEVGALEDTVRALLASYRGPHAVQSFHPGTVRYFRDHAPTVACGLLSGDFRHEAIDEVTREHLRSLAAMDECDPRFIGYDIRLLPNDAVSRARERGLPLIGWTARSAEEGARALIHCDNIIFEGFDPLVLRSAK
jgi:glycerophosphoryl diester phosphodiesterase